MIALPHLNAALNAASAVLLVTGWVLIKQRRIEQHRGCDDRRRRDLVAVPAVLRHLSRQRRLEAVPRHGLIRTIYFAILIPHVILAAAVLPPILITFTRGLRRDDLRHRRIARKTLPVWLFVSVTGVIVYLMLYRLPL